MFGVNGIHGLKGNGHDGCKNGYQKGNIEEFSRGGVGFKDNPMKSGLPAEWFHIGFRGHAWSDRILV